MSNAIRYDSLLLRALAGDLGNRLRGARINRAWFDRGARTLVLELGQRSRPWTLSWNLHPGSGRLALVEGRAHNPGALLQVAAGTPITSVATLPDERILRLQLAVGEAAPGIVRALVVELIGSRWNALALGQDDVVMALLIQRPAGERALQAGSAYVPPAARPRLGWDTLPTSAAWQAALEPVAAERRRQVLLATFAYTSPLNASWILGDAQQPEAGVHLLHAAYARYRELLTAPAQACLLGGAQPYPHPLDSGAGRLPSLLAAFAAAQTDGPAGPPVGESALREAVLARVYERQQRLLARQARLQQEAADATADAVRLRQQADVLLAHLRDVPRGAAEVALEDFEGRPLRLPLDPALTAQQNAQRWYEQARRRARAAVRVPGLLERVARELAELERTRDQVGEASVTRGELEDWLGRAERPARAAALPYRRYRTSGGLEVRVGRSARANDALTREHSSPEDIWLHARDAGGAHVVLRWGRRDANPPGSDLLEAAGLAAWHSRGRTSGLVPVDWTRRKYVRKPRKALPGQVLPERVSTVFVEPDRMLEERLRIDEADE